MPLFLDWHVHKYLPCAPDSHVITLSWSVTPSPVLCPPITAASTILKCLKNFPADPNQKHKQKSCLYSLFSQPLCRYTTCSLSSHLSNSRGLRLTFLTGFSQIFLSGHATCSEYMNPRSEAFPWGSPDMHSPAAAEGLLLLDLQLPGRPGHLFLFLLDKVWEQRGGPTWETQRSVALQRAFL